MENIAKKHLALTQSEPADHFFMPTCIPLLGEHLENTCTEIIYMLLSQGYQACISARNDNKIRVTLNDDSWEYQFTKTTPESLKHDPEIIIHYTIAKLAREMQSINQGLDITILHDIPGKYGYERDPALVLLIIKILNHTNKWNLSDEKIIRYANTIFTDNLDYISKKSALLALNSNTVNSYAAVNAKKDSVKSFKTNFEGFHFIILNPNYLHDYNLKITKSRQKALKQIYDHYSNLRFFKYLSELDFKVFTEHKQSLKPVKNIQYSEHVFSELDRIKNAIDALEDNDMDWFYEYVLASQKSVKTLYEYSHEDLNFLVDTSQTNGAIAARVCGYGYHQMVYAIFDKEISPSLIEALSKRFKTLYGSELYVTKGTLNTKKFQK